MASECVFCEIAEHRARASVVYEDAATMAFIDLRQVNPGHTLVIPKRHFKDVRELDSLSGAALMSTLSLITRAVGDTFPNQGLSIWSSIGEAAFQEVPHVHFHVHPRVIGDEVLRVYPQKPEDVGHLVLDEYAERLRGQLSSYGAKV